MIPRQQHQHSKCKQHTNHIERFICTLRQRTARLVQLRLSFSKKRDNHILTIRFFVANDNLSLQF
uniref:IS1 family transposase n=1 Tax=Larkinella rosea TaxID=2025312 RepID=UPI0021CEA012|nr:IS1 family transposase [Larkinella rosea]